jgi:DNA-binding response OmpR family regulator
MMHAHPAQLRRSTDGCRILVIEDDNGLRGLMDVALHDAGYQVDTACSAEQGVALLERKRYDMVLTDYRLPRESGVWLLREALRRQLLDNTAAVLVTSEPEVPEVTEYGTLFTKPLDLESFLPQIRAILAQGRRVSAADRAARPSADVDRTQPAHIELVLYVAPGSVWCQRALHLTRETLRQYQSADVELHVLDVTQEIEAAERDRIVFTPTLVKRSPPPHVWVLGDLSKGQVLTDLLLTCGISPSRA